MKKNWKKTAAVFAGIFLLLLLMAPVIAARSGMLANWINRNSGLNGTIEIGSSSIGWFSQTEFRNVQLIDQKGIPQCSIEKITLTRSLAGLMVYGVDGVDIHLANTLATVRFSNNRLNWIELLERNGDTENPEHPNLSIFLTDSKINFCDGQDQIGKTEDIKAEIRIQPEKNTGQEIIDINLSAKTAVGEKVGEIDLKASFQLTSAGKIETIDASVDAERSPLGFLNPILDYCGAPSNCAVVHGHSEIHLSKQLRKWQATLQFDNVNVSSGQEDQKQILTGYPIVPFSMNGDLRIHSDSDSEFDISSDYGFARFEGRIPDLSLISWHSLLAQSFQLEGSVDIAKLLGTFPELLRVRKDVELKQGDFNFIAFTRPEGNKQRLFLDLRTDQLQASQNERILNWKNPFRFSLALSETIDDANKNLELEFVQCESDFLTINGGGQIGNDSSGGRIQLNGNLALLKDRLADFFNLGTFQFMGDIAGIVNWTINTADKQNAQFELTGNTTVADFAIGRAPGEGWNEKNLEWNFLLSGELNSGQPYRLEKFSTHFTADSDSATLNLRKPVQFHGDYVAVFDAELDGSGANWNRRLNTFFDTGIQIEGKTNLFAICSVKPEAVRVRSRKMIFEPFQLKAAGATVDERRASVTADLVFNFLDSQIRANELKFESPNLSIQSTLFESNLGGSSPMTNGKFLVSVNCPEESGWTLPAEITANGRIDGLGSFVQSDRKTVWQIDLNSSGLIVNQKQIDPITRHTFARNLIPKSPVRVKGTGYYSNGQLHFDNLYALANEIELKGSGSIDFTPPLVRVDILGEVQSKFEDLLAKSYPHLNSKIQIVGGKADLLALRGPLSTAVRQSSNSLVSPELVGSVKITWDNGEIFSLPLEKGSLRIGLADSVLSFSPDQIRIGNGKFVANSKIILNRDSMDLKVPKGPLIQNAEIAPEVFRTWMRYVTPLLADATEAKGKFSINCDEECRVPISKPLFGDIQAKMRIDSVAVGPGPLGQSLISGIQQLLSLLGLNSKLASLAEKPWLVMPSQDIRMSINNGQVQHEQLGFQLGEIRVFTSGVVDQNQNIDMILYIPVDSDWFKENPVLKSIAGSVIQIPLRGSLSRPVFHFESLRSLSKKLALEAAKSLIENKTGSLLNSDFLKKNIPGGNLLDGDSQLGKLLDRQAKDLLKRGILEGLNKFKKND